MQWLRLPLFVICLLHSGSESLLVLDYPISLYHADSRLSTLIWLRPAYCLYEQWTRETLDASQASRWTAAIQVEVKPEGANSTYKTGLQLPVPQCSPVMEEPVAYQVGPILVCLNDSCTKTVLPGHGYRFLNPISAWDLSCVINSTVCIRYVLYNQAQTRLAATNWSQPFHTQGLPHSFRSIEANHRGTSGGLVTIIVLLSITVFLLLAAAWLAVSSNKHRL